MAPTAVTASGGALNKGCKRCGNVAKTGLKCIQCGTLTHKTCCEKLKIKQIDENSINCCDKERLVDGGDVECLSVPIPSTEVLDNTVNANGRETEIYYLKELLKQKDIIIKNQSIAIYSLQEQISMLKTNVYKSPASSSDKLETTDEMLPYAKVAATINSGKVYRTAVNLPPSESSTANLNSNKGHLPYAQLDKKNKKIVNKPISADAVNNALKSIEARDKMEQIINLENDAKTVNQSNASPVSEIKIKGIYKVKNKPIMGKKVFQDNSMALKAAERKAFLHVYKLHPETEIKTLISYLSPIFPEVKIEKMNALHPQYYSSFKVEIDFTNMDKAMNPDLWPVGTCINRFFHRKKILEAHT